MKSLFLFAFVLALGVCAAAQETDAEGCKDSPLFTRMPHTVIAECTSSFDQLEIPVGADKTQTKEGTHTRIVYNYSDDESSAPSFFQIVKNFETAFAKNGGKRIFYSSEGGVASLCGKSGASDVWVVLRDGGGVKKGNFELNILVMEGMKQDVEAGALLKALNETGSVALYINFETGKADIKPESMPVVEQMVKMLTDAPTLRVSIEGHTDNVGDASLNRALSALRANSLLKALVARGINTTRLQAKGLGQTKPIADNSTEEGRATNRRVEIVKL